MTAFVLTDAIFARIHSSKDKDASIALFSDAFEAPISTILAAYKERAGLEMRQEGIQEMALTLTRYSIPATVKKHAIAASALGCTLTIVASPDGTVTMAVSDPMAVSGKKGMKGMPWTYFLDGVKCLKKDGGMHSSIKALLESLKDGGNKDASMALDALAASKEDTSAGWKLNGWTAAQKMPSLAARITRSR